ncbi:MAG TPA: TonB-dependent receptor [Allosphingosinicella sp.]|nr:TonB-dependent receptor [Allosphingosinicella sp.]
MAQAQPAQTPQPAQAQNPPPPAKKSQQDQGITVTGVRETYSASIDRRTYLIGRDVQGATGSIADVLRNIPSVDVDLNGNVSLRGQGNVTILVDGKPTSLFRGAGGGQTLQQVPASQYERVEVMTNPSAAFSAEGTGGIINLISRRNRPPAFAGSMRAYGGTSGRRGISGSLSNKAGKMTLSADASLRRDPQYSTDIVRFEQFDASGQPVLTSREVTKGVGNLHLWTARAGADFDVDARTRVSAELHHTTFDYHSHMVSTLLGTDPAGALARQFGRDGFLLSNRSDTEGSLSWRRDFAKDHDLSASLTYEATLEDNQDRFANSNLLPPAPVQFDNVTRRDILHRLEAKLDYDRPMPAGGKLQAGYDLQVDGDRYDDRGGFGPDAASAAIREPAFSETFHFDRDVAAFYLIYERPFGKLTAQFGLRAEAANLDLDNGAAGFSRKESDLHLFPSAHAEYALNDRDVLRASVSTRIERPEAGDLDPFRHFSDPFHFDAGNPDLKPQETQSFEFGFEHRKGASLDLATLYYRHSSRGLTDLATDLGGGVVLTTRENLVGSDSLGAELVVNGRITKKLGYRLSGDVHSYRIDASNLGFGTRSAWIVSGKAGLDWQPDKRDFFQANLSLRGKTLLPQGRVDPMLLVNLGFRHKLTNRLWAFVTAQDALHTYQQHGLVRTQALLQRTDDSARTNAAFLGITWNFGGKSSRDPNFDYSG